MTTMKAEDFVSAAKTCKLLLKSSFMFAERFGGADVEYLGEMNSGIVHFTKKIDEIIKSNGRSGAMSPTDLFFIQNGADHILQGIILTQQSMEDLNISLRFVHTHLEAAVSHAIEKGLFNKQDEIGKGQGHPTVQL